MFDSSLLSTPETAVGSKVRVLRGPWSGTVGVVSDELIIDERLGIIDYRLCRVSADGEYLPDEALEAEVFQRSDLWPVWMDETTISVYRNAMDNVGTVCTLSAFLLGQRHREQIMQLRAMQDEHQQKEAKKYLPTATISGVFSPRRKAEMLQRHSGVLCIDIDPSPANTQRWGPQLVGIAPLLRSLPWVCYFAHSCRGVGYYALIRISVRSQAEHTEVFRLLQQQFALMGVELDKACKDVSRNRFLSYDDAPFWRIESEVLSLSDDYFSRADVNDLSQSVNECNGASSFNSFPSASDNTQHGRLSEQDWAIRKIELCVEEAEYRHADVTGTYDECLMLGRSLYALGMKGFDLWCRLCALRSATHTQMRTKKELAVKWMSFRTDTKMLAMTLQQNDPRMKAFFKIIKDHGISYLDGIEREKAARRQRFGK